MVFFLYYIPTHYSSVLSRSLHYYRPSLIIVTSRKYDVVVVTFFLLLQQWFSTISLKGVKFRPTILLESRTESFTTSQLTCFVLLH